MAGILAAADPHLTAGGDSTLLREYGYRLRPATPALLDSDRLGCPEHASASRLPVFDEDSTVLGDAHVHHLCIFGD